MNNIKISNFNLNEDIKIAKDIIDGKINNKSYGFNKVSPICKTTNENISHKPYMEALKNKDRVLSVIGSGDQIINSLLFGTRDVVGVDISIFPKYYLFLKLMAIKVLSKKNYLEYFYGILQRPFLSEYYNQIRNELDSDTRLFWDTLYNDYSDNLYDSDLFKSFNLSYKRAIIHNPFLQDNYYNVVKRNIEKINVELFEYNMFDAQKLDKGYFDLIMLSNIIDGLNFHDNQPVSLRVYNQRKEIIINWYKQFLKSLPLTKNGIALTYNFIFNGSFKKDFSEDEYKVYRLREDVDYPILETEIMIYKKTKHK